MSLSTLSTARSRVSSSMSHNESKLSTSWMMLRLSTKLPKSDASDEISSFRSSSSSMYTNALS